MRSKLKKINNQVGIFRAKVNRFFIKDGRCCILLEEIYSSSNIKLANHVWITVRLSINDKMNYFLKFKYGDEIKFEARVYKYKRKISCLPTIIKKERAYDFSFKEIQNINKIEKCVIF